MSTIEIVGGAILILLSLIICFLVLAQEGTRGGGVGAITGGAEPDSFFSKNSGRSKNMMLFRATRLCAIIFFAITLAVYAFSLYR